MASSEYYKEANLILLNVAVGLGTFIQVLDSSIANVAIPYIAGNLSVSADQGTWVITSFAASNAIVLPLTGWLANYFGSVRLFVWSVALFTIISFLCGLSTSLAMLVFLRVLQGAVAGSLIPLSQSLLMANNPPEKQGSALGFWAMIVIVAPVVGPVVGGYLTDEYSWPWIFYINIPIGAFSAIVTWHLLKDRETKIVRVPIDWVGLFFLAVGVGSLQVMLDKGKDLDWFRSNIIIALTLISAISIIYFVIWTYYQKYPIVDFSFFKNRNFLIGTICITLGFLIYFGSTVTIPLWLQTEQNYTSYWAGVAVAPIGIIPFMFSTTIGKHLYRFDLRIVIAACFLILSAGFFYQANFTTQVDLYTVMLSRLLQGIGIAIFFLPLTQLSFADIPKEKFASATGLFHFVRILVGSGFGTSLSIELWTRLEIFHYSRLSEAFTNYPPIITQFYDSLMTLNPLYTKDVINNLVDKQVEQQAFMLSTNDISYLGAWMFLLMIPLLLLCKPAKGRPESAHEVAH
jgi:DHA2 family multidrug resistance protein